MLTRRSVRGGLLVALVVLTVAAGAGIGRLAADASATPAPSGPSTAAGSASPPVTPAPGGSESPASPTPVPTPTPAPTPVLVPAPLTGLPVTPEVARQHVIAVMVDDLRGARPQAGFSSASIVWQAPAEGGIPRYEMFFQDAYPELVGPIRSTRTYFVNWAAEWRALLAHVGGSPEALSILRSKGQGQLVYNAEGLRLIGSAMWRVNDRPAPHNVLTDAAHLRRMLELAGATDDPIQPVWQFAPDAPPSERPQGGSIVLDYPENTITYAYDAATNTYRRSVSGASPQVDAATGQPIAPKNVVIIRMRFGALVDNSPEKHRLEAAQVGSGDAWIATNGRTIHGTWSKASDSAPTLLFGPDGQPVTLTAGQTFVQVMALSYTYSIRDGIRPCARQLSGALCGD